MQRRFLIHQPLVVALFYCCAATVLAADQPAILTQIDPEEMYLGDTADYAVELRGFKNPSPPDLSALKEDFDVRANGDESRDQSSIVSINGQVTRRDILSHIYHYRLTPKRSGKLKIAAPTAKADGKLISGPTTTINVLPIEEQDIVIPEIIVSRERVYPTQPFQVTARILIRPLPDADQRDPLEPLKRHAPKLEINWVDLPSGLSGEDKAQWLNSRLTDSGVGFTLNEITLRGGGFFDGPKLAVFDLHRGRETRASVKGEEFNYHVYELPRQITAEKPGRYTLGPATVKGMFAISREGGKYIGRRLLAMAPAVEFEVRDVPEPRPASYCGGIGRYRVQTSANPSSLRVGDPLTLTLEFIRTPGSGSLELISAPDLAANAGFADDFEIVDKHPTGRIDGETKRFVYALRPKRAGIGIPSIEASLFDPETEQFSAVSTKPLALEVSEASRLAAGELVGALSGGGNAEIKTREQGIFQNATDPTDLRDQNVDIVKLAELAIAVWGGAACLSTVVVVRRRKSKDVVGQRRHQARRAAEAKLAEAAKAHSPQEAVRTVRISIVGLVADFQNAVAEGMTAADVDARLHRSGVSTELRSAVERLLQSIESAEYGSHAGIDAAAAITQARDLIPPLARALERSS